MTALTLNTFQTQALAPTELAKVVTETPPTGNYRLITGHAASDVPGTDTYTNVKRLEVKAGAGTVWLPYYDSSITCVKLPMDGSCTIALTANLSGCAIYMGRTTAGDLYFCHANSQKGSSKAEMTGKEPSFQAPQAVRELDDLAQLAARNLNLKLVGSLTKMTYNNCAAKQTKNSDDFMGGTTVAGFWANNKWEFWYQTYGSVRKGPNAVVGVEKFYTSP
jgi:hypothetical protein